MEIDVLEMTKDAIRRQIVMECEMVRILMPMDLAKKLLEELEKIHD
jgi:hypothetical protein